MIKGLIVIALMGGGIFFLISKGHEKMSGASHSLKVERVAQAIGKDEFNIISGWCHLTSPF